MSTIVQICVVVVTIAVVLLAYVAARVMLQVEATTKKLEAGLGRFELALEDSHQTSQKIRGLVGVLEQIAVSVRTGVERVELVVERSTVVSSTLLDEIEPPVRHVVAVMRGLRSGIRALTERWTNSRDSTIHSNGGAHDV